MRRAILFGCACIVVVTLTNDRNAVAQSPTVEGAYAFDATGSDDINATIEIAVAKMNFIVRPIARSRLKKTNPVYRRVAIARAGSEIVVTLDDRKPIRMPADGSSIKWTREDGEKFDLKGNWKENELVQTYIDEDGQRVNEFSLGADAGMMRLSVTLTSERLDKPMQYKLLYKRVVSQ